MARFFYIPIRQTMNYHIFKFFLAFMSLIFPLYSKYLECQLSHSWRHIKGAMIKYVNIKKCLKSLNFSLEHNRSLTHACCVHHITFCALLFTSFNHAEQNSDRDTYICIPAAKGIWCQYASVCFLASEECTSISA